MFCGRCETGPLDREQDTWRAGYSLHERTRVQIAALASGANMRVRAENEALTAATTTTAV